MSKRKRDVDEGKEPADRNDYRQQRRIVAAFTQSAQELARAFKTARGFERQKLGRRKKNAVKEKDASDEARIDSEVTALKNLDLTAAAQHQLWKSLLKIKAIATSPDLPAELSKPTTFAKDNATLNVHARLCKSSPVREAFDKLLNNIKREFGVEEDNDAPAKKKRLRKKDFEDNAQEDDKREGGKAERPVKLSMSVAGSTDLGSGSDIMGNQVSESDPDLDVFNDRLASSDNEDEDEEDLNIGDIERQLEAEGVARKAKSAVRSSYDLAKDVSSSEASEGEFDDGVPKRVSEKKKRIPSITMGGYISGSGSDIEDDEVEVAPKKNRRGQRARQQIWEKKYGSGAKHLQNQKSDRGSGWDPKRGAVGGNQRGKKAQRLPKNAGTGMNLTALGKDRRNVGGVSHGSPAKKRHKDDSGPLHPSWEAAKRAKERRDAPVVFAGKKISFD